MIKFIEKDHIYSYKGHVLSSATSFIKKYKKPFDEDHMATLVAIKRVMGENKYRQIVRAMYGRTWNLPKELPSLLSPFVSEAALARERAIVLQEWEDSRTLGTAFHEKRENEYYEVGESVNPFTGEVYPVFKRDKVEGADNYSLDTNLYNLEDGFYPELLLWDNTHAKNYLDDDGNITDQDKYDVAIENTICGLADEVWLTTIDGVRYADTDDLKTNGKPPYEFKGTKLHPSGMYYPPLNHLHDNKVSDYNLQSNLYQYFLSSFGFVRRYAAFTHYKDYNINKSKKYGVPDLSKEIKLIMKEYYESLDGVL